MSFLKILFIDFHWFLLWFLDVLCIVFQSMLRLDPTRRITARGALEHEYFKDIKFVPWVLGFTEEVSILLCVSFMGFDSEMGAILGIFFNAFDWVIFNLLVLTDFFRFSLCVIILPITFFNVLVSVQCNQQISCLVDV